MAPRQKNGTGPFDPLTAARPWPFVEREKPANSLDGQDESDLSYMYGGTEGEGELLTVHQDRPHSSTSPAQETTTSLS